MVRTRNLKRWRAENFVYSSLGEFLESSQTEGLHSIHYEGKILDLLVKDRGAKTTLVVFSGALSPKVKHTPAFSGLGLAEDTNVNLISVADPSMDKGEITVAWYLGDSNTGPIAEVLSKIITHAAANLKGTRLILFGGSGGGYAVTHLAHYFPESIAFVFNPRLNLELWSKKAIRIYLWNCLGIKSSGEIADSEREAITEYGPTKISTLYKDTANHDLLIYHNLLDPQFLQLQLFPFLKDVAESPRILLKFSVDRLGHGAILPTNARAIIRLLSEDTDRAQAIRSAGFRSRDEAYEHATLSYPHVVGMIQESRADLETANLEIAKLRKLLGSASENVKKNETLVRSAQRRVRYAEVANNRLTEENVALLDELKVRQDRAETLDDIRGVRVSFLKKLRSKKPF